MKRHSLLPTLALLIGLLATACEMETLVEGFTMPEPEPFYTTICFLDPDLDTTYILTAKSTEFGSWKGDTTVVTPNGRTIWIAANQRQARDVAVQLHDLTAGKSASAIYSPWQLRMAIPTSELPIVPGHRYRLEVQLPNQTTMSAECEIPDFHPLTYDTVRGLMSLLVRIPVAPTPARYISLELYGSGREYELLSTEGSKEGFLTHLFREDINLFDEGWNASPEGDSLVLYELDRQVYEYFRKSRQLEWSGADPFAEPLRLHTNFNTGQGIFGAVRKMRAKGE